MAYITLSEVQNLIGDAFTVPSAWTTGAEGSRRIDVAIATAKEQIDSATKNTFEAVARTLILNGDNTDLLSTASISRWPLASIAQIKIRTNYDDDFDTQGVLVATNAYCISDSLRSIMRLDGDIWEYGIKNIRLRASFGRNAIPGPVKEAAVLLVREKIQPGYSLDWAQKQSEHFSDGYSYSLQGGNSSTHKYGGPCTGYEAVDVRLAPYVLGNMPGLRSN